MRRFAFEDCLHALANRDDHNSDKVLYHFDDPFGRAPELIVWVADVAGAPDEALGFGLLGLVGIGHSGMLLFGD